MLGAAGQTGLLITLDKGNNASVLFDTADGGLFEIRSQTPGKS